MCRIIRKQSSIGENVINSTYAVYALGVIRKSFLSSYNVEARVENTLTSRYSILQ